MGAEREEEEENQQQGEYQIIAPRDVCVWIAREKFDYGKELVFIGL